MGLFVELEINEEKLGNNPHIIAEIVETCPVDVFYEENGNLRTKYDNEDECTFCGLCLERSPENAIKIKKKY